MKSFWRNGVLVGRGAPHGAGGDTASGGAQAGDGGALTSRRPARRLFPYPTLRRREVGLGVRSEYRSPRRGIAGFSPTQSYRDTQPGELGSAAGGGESPCALQVVVPARRGTGSGWRQEGPALLVGLPPAPVMRLDPHPPRGSPAGWPRARGSALEAPSTCDRTRTPIAAQSSKSVLSGIEGGATGGLGQCPPPLRFCLPSPGDG